MGMIGCFYALKVEDLNAIFEKPARIQKLWSDEMIGLHVEPPKQSFLARLFGLKPEATKADTDPWKPSAKAEAFDVDKAWHGIHFLLTGSASEGEGPLAFVLNGGREIEHDLGYGPPHAFYPQEVKEIANALAGLDLKTLYDKADLDAFTKAEIYPTIWDREPKEECMGYVVDYLRDLREFIQKTAASDRALIAYIG